MWRLPGRQPPGIPVRPCTSARPTAPPRPPPPPQGLPADTAMADRPSRPLVAGPLCSLALAFGEMWSAPFVQMNGRAVVPAVDGGASAEYVADRAVAAAVDGLASSCRPVSSGLALVAPLPCPVG